ncbi:MAG: DUF1699 family protein [Methanothrix sp.]
MKIRIVSSKKEIETLKPNEKAVHLAFRASNLDFLSLLQKSPRLQLIQVPPSYMKTVSKAIGAFLEMQGVALIEGDVWGHRKDLDEYFMVPEDAAQVIKDMTREGAAPEKIAEEVQKTSKMGKALIEYMAKAEMAA